MKGLRKWATPVTVGSFLIMGVTGALMFFHLDVALNKSVHEWAGWVMVAGVAAHLSLNWRAFAAYLKRPMAQGIIGLSALALALSFAPLGGAGGGSPMPIVMGALGKAPVEQVIALGGKSETQGFAALAAAGIAVAPGQSLDAATGGDRTAQITALRALLGG